MDILIIGLLTLEQLDCVVINKLKFAKVRMSDIKVLVSGRLSLLVIGYLFFFLKQRLN
jgi:hypothetical protein